VKRRVLVVDDEKGIRDALRQVLEYEEIDVQACASGSEALRSYPEFRPHLVLLDVKMQGMDGLETLRKLRELDPHAQIVMISGHGTIQTAVEATQLGAYDFLEKPLDTDRILLTLRNALQHVDLASENVRLKAEVHAQYQIVGSSKAIKQVIERIEKVAPTAARVLVTGENGTGKELVARAIHALSPRARGPFVEVNCAAIPTELIESELFGHMKGSFTGAFADRAGKFELADGGTLFLDEVGDMSLNAQAKVLRALEEGVISRVGSGKTLAVDVRVVAATNKDLTAEIAAGRFREDLLYRLNVVPIEVPPLRARRGDIPQLVAHFASLLAGGGGGGGGGGLRRERRRQSQQARRHCDHESTHVRAPHWRGFRCARPTTLPRPAAPFPAGWWGGGGGVGSPQVRARRSAALVAVVFRGRSAGTVAPGRRRHRAGRRPARDPRGFGR
jgi:two-component system nitrogen regulation response regulator NtrX